MKGTMDGKGEQDDYILTELLEVKEAVVTINVQKSLWTPKGYMKVQSTVEKMRGEEKMSYLLYRIYYA